MNVLLPLLIITPIMLLLALGLIVFVVLYQKRLIQHQEQVRQLQMVKQHQVLEATMQAQEEERRRVARDLHDEVGSMLSLVKLNLYQLVGSIEGAGDEVRGAEANIKKLLDEVIGSVRRISHDLMPVVLDKMGLVQALEALRRSVPASSGVTVALECNDKSRRLAPKQELILYRMVQELMNNTLKHANASTINIKLLFTENEVALYYADNGIGFEYGKQQEQGGIGVVSLQSRAELMRGQMKIRSLPGMGTQVEVKIPMQ